MYGDLYDSAPSDRNCNDSDHDIVPPLRQRKSSLPRHAIPPIQMHLSPTGAACSVLQQQNKLLEYVKTNGDKFHVKHIDNLVRSCPLSWHTVTRNGTSTYTILACFNVTRLELAPPTGVSGGCARVAPIVKATCWKKEKKKKKKKEKSRRGGVGPAYATHLLAASVNTHSVNAISAHSISAYAHTTAHSDEVGSPPLHRTIALSPHRRRHSRGALCCALCVVKACHSCLTCHLYQHTHVNLRRLTDNRSLPQTKEKGEVR
ncbi:hypothetical protein TcWFU_008462 [Taenia crassiceps]|uniref:Uncharacterized protein n=1 Tax=Taenia crassiceps TaxID=6207 RepID=A0ABR4Q8M9_9CEST